MEISQILIEFRNKLTYLLTPKFGRASFVHERVFAFELPAIVCGPCAPGSCYIQNTMEDSEAYAQLSRQLHEAAQLCDGREGVPVVKRGTPEIERCPDTGKMWQRHSIWITGVGSCILGAWKQGTKEAAQDVIAKAFHSPRLCLFHKISKYPTGRHHPTDRSATSSSANRSG